MANIHVNGTGNANLRIGNNTKNTDLSVSKTAIARYIGARAVVDRVDEGVRITLTDYQGTTQEIIAEAIADIITNQDGSLTFILADGREIRTDTLVSEIESITNSELEAILI